MAVVPKELAAVTTVGTVSTTLFTAPANTTVVVKRGVFSNTTAGAVSIVAYKVPNGGSPSGANQIITSQSVAANETYLTPEIADMVFTAGESFRALCDTGSALNFTASGYYVTT